MRKKVVVAGEWLPTQTLEAISEEASIVLVPAEDVERMWQELATAHAFVPRLPFVPSRSFPARRELFQRAPNLLIVASAAAGHELIDVKAATEAGVLACNQSGLNAESVAECVVGFMIVLSRKLFTWNKAFRTTGAWRTTDDVLSLRLGRELHGKTVGIIGLGEVGRRVARICNLGLQMRVMAYDPYLTKEEASNRHAELVDNKDELLRQVDFLSINPQLTEETHHIVGIRELRLMKPTAFVIHTSRGGILDEMAFIQALKERTIAGGALDVFDPEPPASDHLLFNMESAIVTPHLTGPTPEAMQRMSLGLAEVVTAGLRGERPPRLINPDVWPRFEARYKAILG